MSAVLLNALLRAKNAYKRPLHLSTAWATSYFSGAGSIEQTRGNADVLVWPPPADTAGSHPALMAYLKGQRAELQQRDAIQRSVGPPCSGPSHSSSSSGGGMLRSAVAELLSERGIAASPDERAALGDLRLLDLRPVLSRYGLATSGSKAAVVERVWQALMRERRSLQEEAAAGWEDAEPADSAAQRPSFTELFSGEEVAQILIDAKTDDVVVLDVRQQNCGFTDEMVIATARSKLHCQSAAQAVMYKLKERCKELLPGVAPFVEGLGSHAYENSDWLVVDAGSVVAHVFEEQARREYDIEGLWAGGQEPEA